MLVSWHLHWLTTAPIRNITICSIHHLCTGIMQKFWLTLVFTELWHKVIWDLNLLILVYLSILPTIVPWKPYKTTAGIESIMTLINSVFSFFFSLPHVVTAINYIFSTAMNKSLYAILVKVTHLKKFFLNSHDCIIVRMLAYSIFHQVDHTEKQMKMLWIDSHVKHVLSYLPCCCHC